MTGSRASSKRRRRVTSTGAVGLAVLLISSGCSTDRVAQAQRANVSLMTRTKVLLNTDRLLFTKTMAVRAGEADDAPIGGFLTRIEIVLPGEKMRPDEVQSALETRALRGGFTPSLRAAQGGLTPARSDEPTSEPQSHSEPVCRL